MEDTRGILPSTIARSAQEKSTGLTTELENRAQQVSDRLTQKPQIAGLLPAPKETIPLGTSAPAPDMPGGLFDAQQFPPQNVGEARVIRQPNGQIMPFADRKMEFPDASGKLPSGRNNNGQFLSRQPTRTGFMTAIDGEVPPTPEYGGPGVLLRDKTDFPAPPPGSEPYRVPLSNDAPSLGPARRIVGDTLNTAAKRNSKPLFDAAQGVDNQLRTNFLTGHSIPERVTPTELLNLKRGVGDLQGSWPLETNKIGGDTVRGVYRALDSELDRTVPGSNELNQRISSLIPVAKRAGAADLNAGVLQRSLGRFGRPTGALLGSAMGGGLGYAQGGKEGAIAGSTAGLFVPEMIASPAVQTSIARALWSPAAKGTLRGITAAGLAAVNKKGKN
jgi:hypothetical protein